MQSYLFKYYKKRINSILSIYEKTQSGLKLEDIHRLRVNIKKVRAVFHLLEIIDPKDFKVQKNDVFNAVFKNAGKIRELQLNRKYLNKYNLISSNASPYRQYARKKEKKTTKKLKKNINDFNHEQLDKTGHKIKQLGKETSEKKILVNSNNFIISEAQKIKRLNANVDHLYKVHRIRKHLKSLDAIAFLLFQIERDKKLKKLLMSIKEAGVLLGTWHDKLVLTDSLGSFIKKNNESSNNNFLPMKKLINRIGTENEKLLKKSYPKINSVLQKIERNNVIL